MNPPPPRSWRILRAAVVAGLLLSLALGIRVGLREQLEPRAALDLLHALKERWWAPPAFVLLYCVGTASFIPALFFHLLSGATWGFGEGVLLNVIGANLSGTAHFFLARWVGREPFTQMLDR